VIGIRFQPLLGRIEKLAAGAHLFNPDLCGDASYQEALTFAEEAVFLGRQAPTAAEPSDALTQWRRADVMWDVAIGRLEQVRACSEFFDPAQERLESYANNREQVQQRILELSEG
ncbi:MAG: hypothetical protein AAGJ55_06250, partial [Cyanobacteria bacterium J06555_12]